MLNDILKNLPFLGVVVKKDEDLETVKQSINML